MPPTQPPAEHVLPPLIFGCAAFNNQFNDDPYILPTVRLVHDAFRLGIRAFDTSPYYGPAELLLGAALETDHVRNNFPRESYYLITKCGRIAVDQFDYSVEHVRASVKRSLERLKTSYLDVVYCHDAEFVTPGEVVTAVQELRRLRDEEGLIKYVGISAYPVDFLCDMAERILRETGEPLDVVQSYCNYSLQNTSLVSKGAVERLRNAGVHVVPNASLLAMGLLRQQGQALGSSGDWHPSPPGLRAAIRKAAALCDQCDEQLHAVATRWAMESWIEAGESVGSYGDPASGVPLPPEAKGSLDRKRLGVSVIGISHLHELHQVMSLWQSVLDGLDGGAETAAKAGRWKNAHEFSVNRKKAVLLLADGVRDCLGDWLDFAWESPPLGFVNKQPKALEKARQNVVNAAAALPTPEGPPEPAAPAIDIPLR